MSTYIPTFEELQEIESRIAEPTISWEELRLYARISKKLQSNNIETTYV